MSLWNLFVNINQDNKDVTDKMEEINRIQKEFLDIWAESHCACTISELRKYEDAAWDVWEPIEDLCDDYTESIRLLATIPYAATRYAPPPGTRTTKWKCQIFQNQRDRIEKRRKHIDRLKFGNRNLRGKF